LEGIPARLVTSLHRESGADRLQARLQRLREALAARGWDECVTDALIERQFAAGAESVEMANPLSELQTHLRPALKPALLQVAARNLARGNEQVRLFETGRVYHKREGTTHEPLRLGLVVAGLAQPAAWYQPERTADFFDLSGAVEFLRTAAALEAADILECGAVEATELKAHGIKVPVFYAEISLEAWEGRPPRPEHYRAVPQFPSVRRDVAVVIGKSTSQAKVEETIRRAKAPNLVSVRLFDLFLDPTGQKIAADQKSLAYALTYRAADRTLTEKDVSFAHELVRKKLVEELGCAFRE
jgi:phenylalanyl-tRNA synthetase beta chain